MAMLNSYTTRWNFDSNQQIVVKTYFDKKKKFTLCRKSVYDHLQLKAYKKYGVPYRVTVFLCFFFNNLGDKAWRTIMIIKTVDKAIKPYQKFTRSPSR